MIYTVGHTESYCRSYKRHLVSGLPFYKTGRHNGFSGGSVWKTKKKAESHCDATRSVFGVLANWKHDTTPSDMGDWHDLLIDAELVILIDCEEKKNND